MQDERFLRTPEAVSGLDRFFQDHPLPFLSRDPSQQRLDKCPETLTSLRESLLTRDWSPTTPEEELGISCANEIYLMATGNFEGPGIFSESPRDEVAALKQSHRLCRSSFGFLKEFDPESLTEAVKLGLNEIPTASLHRLLQFCVSRGVHVGHDTERDELCEIARWIINSENDGVSFKNLLLMMQQAIDLAVLAQHTPQLEGSVDGDAVLERLARRGVEVSQEMRRIVGEVRHEGAALVGTAQDAGQAKATAEFQAKVLHAIVSAQARDDTPPMSEE